MTIKEAQQLYFDSLINESEEREKQIIKTLSLVKELVSLTYFKAIKQWIEDDENGIWGKLEIVTKPKGEWQDEGDYDYWAELKGMYVEQYVGYCGDDYSGYLTVKLHNNKYLQACFAL